MLPLGLQNLELQSERNYFKRSNDQINDSSLLAIRLADFSSDLLSIVLKNIRLESLLNRQQTRVRLSRLDNLRGDLCSSPSAIGFVNSQDDVLRVSLLDWFRSNVIVIFSSFHSLKDDIRRS